MTTLYKSINSYCARVIATKDLSKIYFYQGPDK